MRTHAAVLILVVALGISQAAAAEPALRAGAARVDITPAVNAALPMSGYSSRTEGFKAIHDPIYVRAVALEDGPVKAAIVVADVIGFPHALWEKITRRITEQAGIPGENILLAGTHSHAAPDPRNPAWAAKLEESVPEAVRRAQANLQPARVGFGAGRANVNINRRARTADGGWWLGLNPDGTSDKTVAVVKFANPAGEPIAIFSNYAVHGTVTGPRNYEISGDLPGAAARFVEKHYGDRVVAPWTSGAAGDQNAIYGPGTDFSQVEVLGQILGEEIVRVAGGIKPSRDARIRGAQKVVSCPGRRLAPGFKPRATKHEWVDADPVEIRLSLLRIGNIALAGVSGEVLTMIGQRLKKESRLPATMMLTHCNGSSGYLPDDAAYQQVSYEITTARVKPGCAEKAIASGLVDMIRAR
ncbi:MAG: neutral/alkaline non-lysosomal ceramidase N-terminal domain-containing protein [Acidobacteriota bacterium]